MLESNFFHIARILNVKYHKKNYYDNFLDLKMEMILAVQIHLQELIN